MNIKAREAGTVACPAGKRQADFPVDGREGLFVRVFASGKRSWMVRYEVRVAGKVVERKKRLGDATLAKLEDIEHLWSNFRNAARQGRDLIGEQQDKQAAVARSTRTLDQLFDAWWETEGQQKPSGGRDETAYRIHVKPKFGQRAITAIRRSEWKEHFATMCRLDDVGEHSGYSANRAHSAVGRMYLWALDREWVETSPLAGMKSPFREEASDRHLSDSELRLFWLGVELPKSVRQSKRPDVYRRQGDYAPQQSALPRATQLALRLLLLTAVRRGSLVGAERRELVLTGSEPYWLIPAGRMKAREGFRRPHLIPLCPLAIEAFTEALALAGNSPYVFPGRDDVTAPIDRMSLTHAMFRLSERLRKKAVIEGGEHAPEFKEKLSAHDLRRSASVFMGRNKVHREDRGKVLAHVDESMTAKNYSPFDDLDAKRAALLALEGHIQKICKFGAPTVPDRTPLTSRLKIRRREFA